MKIQLFIFFVLWSQINLSSQDSLSVKMDTIADPVFLNNYDYLQLNKEDISEMWFFGTELGFEVRLLQKFSLRNAINIHKLNPYINGDDLFSANNFTFGGVSAFINYYPFSYDPSSKKTNLSGMYIGAGFGLFYANEYESTTGLNVDSLLMLFKGERNNFARKEAIAYGPILSLGYQQKLFDIMYYNIRINVARLKVNQFESENMRTVMSLSKIYILPSLDLGFSIHSARKKYNFANYQLSKTHLIKFDFRSLFQSGLNISYEQFISDKPISWVGGASLYFNKNRTYKDENFIIPRGYDHFINNSLYGELRYYHNLKKRRSQGKSGNGFSANYLAMNITGNRNLTRREYDDRPKAETLTRYEISNLLLYGFQRELGKHLYIDARFGFRIMNIDFSESDKFSLRFPSYTWGLYFGFTK